MQSRQRRARQRLQQELNWACRQRDQKMEIAKENIARRKEILLRQDSFLANPELTPKHNACNALKSMRVVDYQSMLRNMRFHNLCTYRKAPPGAAKLLGLNLSFCLQTPRPNQDIDKTMERLRADVRQKAFFCDLLDEGNFNPKTYIPSKWNPPPPLAKKLSNA